MLLSIWSAPGPVENFGDELRGEKGVCDPFCVECFRNPEVKSWFGHHGEPGYCEFCCKQSTKTVFAESFVEALLGCVYIEFSTPVEDGMSHITAEGGWVGETFESDVPLNALGLITDDETRLEALEGHLDTHSWLWCKADHRQGSPLEQALLEWREFCDLTKHRIRYVFLLERQEGITEHRGRAYHVREVLSRIGRAAKNHGVIQELKAGTTALPGACSAR